MAHPPFNIFTQNRDPEGALARLRALMPETEVEFHADGQWSRVRGVWKRGWLKKALTMTVNHDPDYYRGAEWETLLAGMASYFMRFSEASRRPDLFEYVPGLTFAINFTLDPDPVDDDPRQAVIFEMAQTLGGVIFLPGCLLDGQGRTIAATDGETDENAELPPHTVVERTVRSGPPAPDSKDRPWEPPSVERVALRFQWMAAMVWRGFAESETETDRVAKEETLKQMRSRRGSAARLEGEEWEIRALETPVGKLDEGTVAKLQGLSEGAMVLAWALNLAQLPPYDVQVDPENLYRHVLRAGQETVSLREPSEIQALDFQMLAIHWRLSQLRGGHKPMDFAAYAPKAWCGPMDLTLARLQNNDLEVGGKPVSECAEKAIRITTGILQERRQATHWLMGQDPVYSANAASI